MYTGIKKREYAILFRNEKDEEYPLAFPTSVKQGVLLYNNIKRTLPSTGGKTYLYLVKTISFGKNTPLSEECWDINVDRI